MGQCKSSTHRHCAASSAGASGQPGMGRRTQAQQSASCTLRIMPRATCSVAAQVLRPFFNCTPRSFHPEKGRLHAKDNMPNNGAPVVAPCHTPLLALSRLPLPLHQASSRCPMPPASRVLRAPYRGEERAREGHST